MGWGGVGYKYVGLFLKGDFRICLEIPEKTVSFLWCQLNGGLLCEMRWSSWLGNVERRGWGTWCRQGLAVTVNRDGSLRTTTASSKTPQLGVQPYGPLKPAVVSKTGNIPYLLWMLVDVKLEAWASWWNECGNTGVTRLPRCVFHGTRVLWRANVRVLWGGFRGMQIFFPSVLHQINNTPSPHFFCAELFWGFWKGCFQEKSPW